MSERLSVRINAHGNPVPERITVGDWIDLRCAETVTLNASDYRKLSLGISMELPDGYEAHILPRSSTFQKWGITMACSMGIVDNSYCGDNDIWLFPAIAHRSTTIYEGDRIAQFRIVKKQPEIEFIAVENLGNKNRGGLGSTGSR